VVVLEGVTDTDVPLKEPGVHVNVVYVPGGVVLAVNVLLEPAQTVAGLALSVVSVGGAVTVTTTGVRGEEPQELEYCQL
jgi:hypothetical protein